MLLIFAEMLLDFADFLLNFAKLLAKFCRNSLRVGRGIKISQNEMRFDFDCKNIFNVYHKLFKL